MKRLFFPGFAPFVLAASLAVPVRSQLSETPAYVGCVAGFTGTVEWRADAAGQPVVLRADKDRYRPLYRGNQVRCRENAELRVFGVVGREWSTRSTSWVAVPESDVAASIRARDLGGWQQAHRALAESPRGAADLPTQARRAVVVGINHYRPPGEAPPRIEGSEAQSHSQSASASVGRPREGWTDLDGCVNDALTMRDLLIARFGFRPADILMLTNAAATRQGILDALRTHLIEPATNGTLCFFFYAGHGSQVRNSKSKETDRRDETLVPSDASLGQPDLRDKELRRCFNAILDRGALLTAVFDSCHSGSVARGLLEPEKSRYLPGDDRDIADDSDPGPFPEERGALVISAALDSQTAGELRDANDEPHGRFSAALFQVLRHRGANTPAQQVFQQVKAAMQAEGREQEPVLGGIPARRTMSLFGLGGAADNKVTVAAKGLTPQGLVALQGGRAIGLAPGCELREVGVPTNQAVCLRIAQVDGMSSARATILSGSRDRVRTNNLFEVTRWTVPPEAMLQVWLPPAGLSASELEQVAARLAPLRASSTVRWVEDPTVETPDCILAFEDGRWVLRHLASQRKKNLAGVPDAASTEKAAQEFAAAGAAPRLYVAFPPSKELRQRLALGAGTANDALELVTSPARANYLLLGSLQAGQIKYAWVLPTAYAGRESDNQPLPVRTDWFPTNQQPDASVLGVAARLEDRALRLGKVRSWLALQPAGETAYFPYGLALRKLGSQATLQNDLERVSTNPDGNSPQADRATVPTVVGGEAYKLCLIANTNDLARGVIPHFVYVFILDREGRGTLLFPDSELPGENRFPIQGAGPAPPPEYELRTRSVTIDRPYGLDNYILVASRTAIDDPDAFNFDGVRTTQTATRGRSSPLQRLLEQVGDRTRGARVTAAEAAPADWTIQRLMVRSVPPPGGE